MKSPPRPSHAAAALLAGAAIVASACSNPSPADIYVGAPGTTDTHALVTVQPGRLSSAVWRLVSTAGVGSAAGSKAYLPDPPPSGPITLPTQYTIVARNKTGTLHVSVDALSRDGEVVARANGSVELIAHSGVPLTLTLDRPCESDADCSNGIRCDGEERCVAGLCAAGVDPCASPVACLDSTCVEGMPGCVVALHADRCPAGNYCDTVLGCTPGVPCLTVEDCHGLGDECNPFECVSGHCHALPPVIPNDGNPCTVEYCQPGRGVVTQNLGVGNVCSAQGEPVRRVCRDVSDGGVLTCEVSTCGDAFVDRSFGEECDLGPTGNDDETCTHLCRLPRCGDGIVSHSLLEECDDGNSETHDDCVACRTARCGDGQQHLLGTPPFEQCDDGPLNGVGACSTFCRLTSFDVLQIMGRGAPCPATTPDGGFPLLHADGGWNYQDAGPFITSPSGDSRCMELYGVQEITLRSVSEQGDTITTDELLVADTTGLRAVNIRTMKTEQIFASDSNPTLRACVVDPNLGPWVRYPSEGLPGSSEGLEGLSVYNNLINYRTASSHMIFRALLPIPAGGFSNIQYFSYIGTAQYSVAECCNVDLPHIWRPSMCNSCPQVDWDSYPRAFFDFLGKVFLVSPDRRRRALHAQDGERACDTSIVTFAPCSELGAADAGALGPWKYATQVPLQCLEGNTVAMIVSGPGMHKVERAGINLPQDISRHCMSSFRTLAGTEGRPGNSPPGTLASEALIDTPTGTGIDENCNIYFADTGNHAVRQITRDGVLHTVADIPGLTNVAVHPTLGVVASTVDKIFLVAPRVENP